MKNFLVINTVADYLKLRGQEVLHPLVGLVDFKDVNEENKVVKGHIGISFNCYAIFLKDAKGCKMKYGGKDYDYDEGTIVFIGPGQHIELTKYDANYKPKGYALIFDADILLRTELFRKINRYTFFSYSVNEALHLSARERKVLLSLLDKIEFELEQNLDKHSKNLIVSNIELFLDYCTRFYDRQFLTRETENQSSLGRFQILLNSYFSSDKPQKLGLPSVGYFAEQLHLSANYFGDLVKKETGKTAKELIQEKLVEMAKEKIFDPNKSVSEIAYELGFKYPQHFSRLFKKQVGYSPTQFKLLN